MDPQNTSFNMPVIPAYGYGNGNDGMSSRRGRAANGRYVSREMPQPDPAGGEFGYPFPNGQQYPNSGYSGRYYPPRW